MVQSKSNPQEGTSEQAHASREELVGRIARHLEEDGQLEAAPGLFLYRSSAPTGPRYGVNEASFCVIAQGSKQVLLGRERYRYDADHYLLVSVGLPVVSHIVKKPCPSNPFGHNSSLRSITASTNS